MFELKKEMQRKRGSHYIIAAPRGHAKSTIITFIFTIHAIVYETERYIVVCSNTDTQATERVQEIRDALDDNKAIKRIFGALKNKKKWNQDDFTTTTGIRVMARSVGSELRGTRHKSDRPTLFIFDDLENSKTIYSPAIRMQTEGWFESAPMKAGAKGGEFATNFLMVGTVLHRQGLMAKKLQSPLWQRRFYQAVLSWPERNDLWDQWRQIITDRSLGDLRSIEARAFYEANEEEMMRGVKTLWEAWDPFYDLMLSIIDGGMAAFNAEKQNNPHDPDAQMFRMDQAKTFRIIDNKIIERVDNKFLMLSDLTKFAFLDPTLANTAGSDYAAITVLGVHEATQDQYVLDAWLSRLPPSEQIKKLFELHRIWNFREVGFESNLFQSLLKPLIDAEGEQQGMRLPARGVQHFRVKEPRIGSMEPTVANGWLLFNEALRHTEFWNQWELFPYADQDDGPDSTQGAQELAGVSRLVAA